MLEFTMRVLVFTTKIFWSTYQMEKDKDFGYVNGLIYHGKIDGRTEVLNASGSLNVRIELVQL